MPSFLVHQQKGGSARNSWGSIAPSHHLRRAPCFPRHLPGFAASLACETGSRCGVDIFEKKMRHYKYLTVNVPDQLCKEEAS